MKLSSKIVWGIVALCVVIALTQIDFSEAAKKQEEPKEPLKPLVEVASHTDNLGTFVVALKTAGLVDSLNKGGHYTIFAPSDTAFTKLPDGTFADLMQKENKNELKKILLYHIVADTLMTDDFKGRDSLKTLEGQKLMLSSRDDTVIVNGTKVVKRDIRASNGVIHVVDSILGPPEKNKN